MNNKKIILVGSTGFVGQNLMQSHCFDEAYHSTNIAQAYGTCPDILVYAGMPGTKFLANRFPEKDREKLMQAKENIVKIGAKKVILISTVDVYNCFPCTEECLPTNSAFQSYGNHRLLLETWCKEHVRDLHIIRLPGIYGDGLKKNLIYDIIHIVPKFLNEKTYDCLMEWQDISAYYRKEEAMYVLRDEKVCPKLRNSFLKAPVNALSFTNPESRFQYYNLKWLWEDICLAIKRDIRVLNIACEPVSAKEILELMEISAQGGMTETIVNYDMRTKYSAIKNRSGDYLYDREMILGDLEDFIVSEVEKWKMR